MSGVNMTSLGLLMCFLLLNVYIIKINLYFSAEERHLLCRSLFVVFSFFFRPLCCFSQIYGFGLPLQYLLVIVLFVFLDLQLLITPLVSFGHCVVCLLRFTASDYPFGILDLRLLITPLVCLVIVLFVFLDLQLMITPLVSFGHCVVCLLRFLSSDYSFGIFKLLAIVFSVFH